MKGIVLAGGNGTRLYPLTKVVSKQLLPVYDKPMIYYSLSTLLLSGIKDILIISTPQDIKFYEQLFSDGSQFGLNIQYKIQPSPDGLAQAFILGEDFIGDDNVALVLGDNIFYGSGFSSKLKKCVNIVNDNNKAVVFGYEVKNPKRYGVVDFDNNGNATSIEEKPQYPKSNYAVVGLYFYPNEVIEIAKRIKPSERGELEITSVNQAFLKSGKLQVKLLDRGFAWLDTGTPESLIEAGQFIHTVEKRQGIKVACLEEIAFEKGWINHNQLLKSVKDMYQTEYRQYLLDRYQK